MSTVKQKWNEFVGERPQVRNFKLKIDETSQKLTDEAKEILLNSKRKYQAIEIKLSEDNLKFFVSLLAMGSGLWKVVYIQTCGPISQDMWPEILKIVEPSVTTLKVIDDCCPAIPSKSESIFTFPLLKYLVCVAGFNNNVSKYFYRVTSLVNFCFCLPPVTAATLDVLTILCNNKNLRELRATTHHGAFYQYLLEIKLKLQKLVVIRPDNVESMRHLASFLKTQAETLESLEIPMELDQTFLEIILGMPKLKSLKFFSISGEIHDLPVNLTITSFEAQDGITKEHIAYQTLLKAMRNLKHLKCSEINDEMFLFLALDISHLKSIDVNFFNVGHVYDRKFFPNIEDFRARKFRRNLQEPTGQHSFANMVRREMRKLLLSFGWRHRKR